MSYELQIWSVYPATRASLNDKLQWNDAPSGWSHATRDWQIVVSHSDRVLAEDIPDDVATLLPGIQYLTQINLEGRISDASTKAAISTGSVLARGCHGVLVDPQKGSSGHLRA